MEPEFAAKSGKKMPFGLALDKFGKPTNDGAKAFEGIMYICEYAQIVAHLRAFCS